MSFCQDVKQEVMKNPLREFHCRGALVYAVLKLSKSFPQEPTIFTTENRELAEEVATMLAELGAIVDIRREGGFVKQFADHPQSGRLPRRDFARTRLKPLNRRTRMRYAGPWLSLGRAPSAVRLAADTAGAHRRC